MSRPLAIALTLLLGLSVAGCCACGQRRDRPADDDEQREQTALRGQRPR